MDDYQQAKESHQHCMVCGNTAHDSALQLQFSVESAGVVSAEFTVPTHVQGYEGLQHGGMTSTLLDAAMTHCLFSLGLCALTAELNVRFIAPIKLGQQLVISASLQQQKRGVYLLSAEINENSQLVAKAKGKFIKAKTGDIFYAS